MATKWMLRSDNFFPTSDEQLCLCTELAARNYVVEHSERMGFYLKPLENFELPTLYGQALPQAERILNTFKQRSSATGVLLHGEKGSGKTLLSKVICEKARQDGIPILLIAEPFCGPEFNTFIQGIDQPCVIVFDEFEKVFDKKDQRDLLTLLDGVFPSKKLFLLTCNAIYGLTEQLINRPGRLYYALEFKGVEWEFIEEYCDAELVNKKHLPAIQAVAEVFDAFSFDLLKALVEEVNRYDEDPFVAIQMLNATPACYRSVTYALTLFIDGVEQPSVREISTGDNPTTACPLTMPEYVIQVDSSRDRSERDRPLLAPTEKGISTVLHSSKEERPSDRFVFTLEHLQQKDFSTGRFVFDDGEGAVLLVQKIVRKDFSFAKLRNAMLAA